MAEKEDIYIESCPSCEEEESITEETEEFTFLEERVARKRRVVVQSRDQQIQKIGQRSAMGMAKANNDPLYTRYRKYRDLEIELRKQIERKYGSRAKAAARKK